MDDGAARGRPRSAETDRRLRSATVDLLRERGPAGVTIEAVASRSGVARTTIYRRFASRRELIEAALDPVVDRPLPPADLSMEGKVRWVLDQVAELFETGLGRGTLAAIMVDSDPEFTGALRTTLERRLDGLRTEIQSDMDAGRVSRQLEPDAVVGLLFGAYLGEVLRHGSPRKRWLETTVDLLVRSLEPAPGTP